MGTYAVHVVRLREETAGLKLLKELTGRGYADLRGALADDALLVTWDSDDFRADEELSDRLQAIEDAIRELAGLAELGYLYRPSALEAWERCATLEAMPFELERDSAQEHD